MKSRRQPEIIGGRVNGALIVAGDGFSVRNTGTGVWVIALPWVPTTVVATSEAGGRSMQVTLVASSREVTISGFVSNTLAADNQPFDFVAVGPMP